MKTSHLIVCTLSLVLVLTSSSLISAADEATPSGDKVEITENIKNRLKETINAVQGQEIGSAYIGYVGKVKDIVKNTMVVEDKSGKKNVLISDTTTIVRSPGNTTIKLDSVRIGDAVIAIGTEIDDKNETQGKRIIVSETPFNPPDKVTGLAKVSKITASSVSVTPVDGALTTLTLTSKSVIKSSTASLELEDLNIGDTIIYSALVDPKTPTKSTVTVIMRIKEESEADLLLSSPSPSPKSNRSPAPEY